MKKLTYMLVMVTMILFVGLAFFSNPLLANTTNEFDKEKDAFLNIITVNKLQYYMVKAIVGENHNVEYLLKNEKDISEFTISENVSKNISNMDLFIYTGLGYEPWINELIDSLEKGKVGIINMARGIRPITYTTKGVAKENPYYLLGINEYKIALYNIKSAIQERDVKNRNIYEESYKTIIDELDKILVDAKSEINKYNGFTIITDTHRFDYLMRDLGLTVMNVELGEVRKTLKEKNIDESKTIYIKDKSNLGNSNEILECKEIQLISYDSEISIKDAIVSNIGTVTGAIKEIAK